MRCPMCQNKLTPENDAEVRPFCSPRCKKIDLSNWLEGAYSLPRELNPEELEQLPSDKRDEVIAAAMGVPVERKLH